MNKNELTELVIEKVTAIAFRDSLSVSASVENRFRADLGFSSLDIYDLNSTLANEITKRTDEQLILEDFEIFWMDFDATVQDLINYIADKLCIAE